jgi:phosphoglycolate phosphatase-like HAD superfamily hydrolase
VLVVGDTRHDAEVAAALGADCILVLTGHQSEAMLGGSGERIARCAADVCAMI